MMGRRRIGRPGLVGTMARTAVVAGTATAVVGGVSAHQQQKQAAAAAAAAPPPPPQPAYAPEPAPAPAAAPAPEPAAAVTDDTVAQLQKLGEMKEQGLLTDEEFSAMKAKVLGL